MGKLLGLKKTAQFNLSKKIKRNIAGAAGRPDGKWLTGIVTLKPQADYAVCGAFKIALHQLVCQTPVPSDTFVFT